MTDYITIIVSGLVLISIINYGVTLIIRITPKFIWEFYICSFIKILFSRTFLVAKKVTTKSLEFLNLFVA